MLILKLVVIMISGKSNSGKGSVADVLKYQLSDDANVIQCSLSTYIRNITKNDFYWDGVDTPESRKFMAEVYRLGTEFYPYHMSRRVFDRDIRPNLKEGLGVINYAIVESFRELVNYEYFKKLEEVGIIDELITIRVDRPEYDVVKTEFLKSHVSETDLDNFKFDHYIINDGTLQSLTEKVTYTADMIKGGNN